MAIVKRYHEWTLSDAPGAAYAFAGTILGGTFAAIVTIAAIVSAVLA